MSFLSARVVVVNILGTANDVIRWCRVVKCSTTVPAGTLPDQDAAITTFRGIASVYLKRQLLWDFVPPGIYYLFTAVSTGARKYETSSSLIPSADFFDLTLNCSRSVLGLDERAVLWL